MCDTTIKASTGFQRSTQVLRARSLETQCDCTRRHGHSPLQAFTEHIAPVTEKNCTKLEPETNQFVNLLRMQSRTSHLIYRWQEPETTSQNAEERKTANIFKHSRTRRDGMAGQVAVIHTALHDCSRCVVAENQSCPLGNGSCEGATESHPYVHPKPTDACAELTTDVRSTPAHPRAGTARRA